MLDTTLATKFVPGTNLKGDVAGANWAFLLPSVELEHAVCIGTPPPTTLEALSRVSRSVLVLAMHSQRFWGLDEESQSGDLPNVYRVTMNGRALPLSEGSVDLLLIQSGTDVQWLSQDRALRAQLLRLLKPEGLVYFEFTGPVERLPISKTRSDVAEDLGEEQVLWLTPFGGEMHTAVPLNSYGVIDYFLRHKLNSPSLTPRTFKRLKRFLNGHRPFSRPARPSSSSARSQATNSAAQSQKRLHPMVRDLGAGMLRAFDGAERFIHRYNQSVGRYGVLIGRTALTSAKQPPRYLRMVARDAGVDIDGYRWGLSAPGDYSSRKVLFFLFSPSGVRQRHAGNRREMTPPEYVIKLTRDPMFNRRLENEYRALSLLYEKGVRDPETLPQVVFFGYHNDLAIVGETVIDGEPFRERTTATAACPHANAAINWLVELGVATTDPTVASPAQVAEALQTLFRRFMQIYRLTPAHRDFLIEQIAAIGHSQEAFPAVFQHGDPGTWNMMVTRTGRVAFLDWEAAESQGVPLWDLFYFLRSFCIWSARVRGTRNRLQSFTEQFLAESPLSSLVIESTMHYCDRIGLSTDLVGPLFYTCWMHRALKEATRLTPAKLDGGHYLNLLRLCIEQRNAPTLGRLFALS